MSLLASVWSRECGAGIRRGTLGALVGVQNLVIAGSSGLVHPTALFFYSCTQSFHILEVAWRSRWECGKGVVCKMEISAAIGRFRASHTQAIHTGVLFLFSKMCRMSFTSSPFGLFLLCLEKCDCIMDGIWKINGFSAQYKETSHWLNMCIFVWITFTLNWNNACYNITE